MISETDIVRNFVKGESFAIIIRLIQMINVFRTQRLVRPVTTITLLYTTYYTLETTVIFRYR